MIIQHFEKVDTFKIKANFTDDKRHRLVLIVPFIERTKQNNLCIIGQNPSDANEYRADKTLRYLEQFVFQNLPEYSGIIMLNLYSRIDTKKKEINDLERPETKEYLHKTIQKYSDILLAFGVLKKHGEYNFPQKYKEIKPLLMGKNVFCIDTKVNTNYPPHPGNPKILYNNYEYGVTKFEI